jgi:F-type H+-transporting ATPase subunit gamma
VATRPYSDKLAELVADLSSTDEPFDHPLMRTPPTVAKSAVVVITSSRGLCGGYNSNILRTAIAHLDESRGRGVDPEVYMVGKKGVNYFKFLNRPTVERITTLGDSPRFDQIEPLANLLMERFIADEVQSVDVVHMRFYSVGRQKPEALSLLPLRAMSEGEPETPSSEPRRSIWYEYSPEPAELMRVLLPATVRMRLFQCFTDAAVSEQVARMVAMKAATESAGEMITQLTRRYNRARQTQITMELLDIVGGANALA